MPFSEYLAAIVSPMLRFPEDMRVTETQDQMGVLLTLSVHKDDMGTVVGKAGATASAIRQLVRMVGLRGNARVSLKINEPDGSPYKHSQ